MPQKNINRRDCKNVLMEDVSNRTLAIMLGVVIMMFTIGILIIPKGGPSITGFAVNITTGTANVTIQSVTQITLINNTVDFGIGFVNGSANACNLTSNSATKEGACQGFFAPAISPLFVLENNGNVNVTLQINGSYANARAFFCNASVSNQNCTFSDPTYLWQSGNFEAGSCPGSGSSGNLNTSAQTVCGNLDFNSSKNSIVVAVQISIPRDSRQGHLVDAVLFTATG